MPQVIVTINLGGINCYLIKNDSSCILIDTGTSTKRIKLEEKLQKAGCHPANLKLIVLTHGDLDHAGNCEYLRRRYGARIAMHLGDSGMVENGDMYANRKIKPDKISTVFRILSFFFGKPVKFETFRPDMYIDDGFNFSDYGADAKVVSMPGHSKGSIGILAFGGNLICGDLFVNILKPRFHFMIDDLQDAHASVEKLRSLKISTVYPGHGKPFSMDLFIKNLHAD